MDNRNGLLSLITNRSGNQSIIGFPDCCTVILSSFHDAMVISQRC